jgi:Flp pilus assembly protein TadG
MGWHAKARNFISIAHKQDGAAAVEFAMILPVLIVMLFGVIEIGRLLNDFHVVSKSVRDATRYLTRVPMDCPSGGPSSGPLSSYLVNSGDETIARNLALTGSPAAPTVPGDYLLRYWTDVTTISVTVNCVANGGQFESVYAGVTNIPRITMTATVPFTFLWGALVLDSSTITMSIAHNEVNVGE